MVGDDDDCDRCLITPYCTVHTCDKGPWLESTNAAVKPFFIQPSLYM